MANNCKVVLTVHGRDVTNRAPGQAAKMMELDESDLEETTLVPQLEDFDEEFEEI